VKKGKGLILLIFAISLATSAVAQDNVLRDSNEVWRQFINETSGELALKDAAEIGKFNRLPATPGFARAAEYVASRAREDGLSDVEMENFPADGKTYYNTFRSDTGWAVHGAQLWMIAPDTEKLADYDEENLSLAWYSRSADVTAPVVDVGYAVSDAEFQGKDFRGKIILTSGDWGKAMQWGVLKGGAEGIIEYSLPNSLFSVPPQRVTWAALSPPPEKGFMFVLSYEMGSRLSSLVRSGKAVQVHATVDTTVAPGSYQVVTGIIPGTDRQHELLFSAHLDHPTESANDDAAGCAVLLDIARVWAKLIREGHIPAPVHTIRFLWQSEMSGSMAYIARHPEAVQKTFVNIRLGIIGADLTKSKSFYNFNRSRGSAPTFVSELGEMMTEKVLADSIWWMPSPLPVRVWAKTGSRNPLYARIIDYFGEDDYTFDDSTTGFPSVGFNGGPDMNRHTSADSMDKLDTTQMKRTSFLGLSVAWMAAMATQRDADWIGGAVYTRALKRLSTTLEQADEHLDTASKEDLTYAYRESLALTDVEIDRENRELDSIENLIGKTHQLSGFRDQLTKQRGILRETIQQEYDIRCQMLGIPCPGLQFRPGTEGFSRIVPRRVPTVKGPMFHWTKSYLVDKLGSTEASHAKIYSIRWWPSITTEILNLADGKRSVLEISDEINSEFDFVPPEWIYEYLQLLKRAGVIEW
jgi:aminopeptidase YwaD